ncbi:MAG: hypothetical protein JNG90_15590 [Planctomycetaceae bacterium]|nr:hypothetical protein [Planctomycetaceae bacterium]
MAPEKYFGAQQVTRMLPVISERFERAFCRVLFVALCVVPTLTLGGWTYYQRLPSHRLACEQMLTRQLGLAVRLGSVEHTRPGDVRLLQVELREPETNELIARIGQIDARRHGHDWWVALAAPDLVLDGCQALTELLDRQLRWPTGGVDRRIHIVAEHACLRDGEQAWKVKQVAAAVTAAPRHAEARLVFHWEEGAAEHPVSLKVARERDRPEPMTRLDLQTGEAPFPITLLRPWLAAGEWVGPKSTLVGRGRLDLGRQSRRWTVQGRFDQVELGELVTRHFGHDLRGTAQVLLDAEGDGDRLLQASGELASRKGVISRSFLQALGQELSMSVAQLPAAMGEQVRFEELRLGYRVTDDGALALSGASRYAEGALLVDHNGVLVREPPTTQDTAALIRALAVAGTPSLPASAPTAVLSRVLPMRTPGARSAPDREPPPRRH